MNDMRILAIILSSFCGLLISIPIIKFLETCRQKPPDPEPPRYRAVSNEDLPEHLRRYVPGPYRLIDEEEQ